MERSATHHERAYAVGEVAMSVRHEAPDRSGRRHDRADGREAVESEGRRSLDVADTEPPSPIVPVVGLGNGSDQTGQSEHEHGGAKTPDHGSLPDVSGFAGLGFRPDRRTLAPWSRLRSTGLAGYGWGTIRGRRIPHGTHAARQGLGSPHGPHAALRPDAAPDRPAPHPRGHDAAGLPDAQGAEAQGPDAGAHVRHA